MIEMHIVHDYTHYVQSRKCTDIWMMGRPAHHHFSQKLDDGPDDGSPALTRRLARWPVVF